MRSITTLSLEDVVDEGATFEPATLAAVERLARRKPWRLGDREALEAFQTCVDALCVAYRMRPICLVRRGGTGMSDTSWHDRRGRQITLCGRRSVVTLLHLFARCRQAQATGRTDRYAAMRWSINLFRVAFPRSFARCQLVDGLLVNERRNETL